MWKPGLNCWLCTATPTPPVGTGCARFIKSPWESNYWGGFTQTSEGGCRHFPTAETVRKAVGKTKHKYNSFVPSAFFSGSAKSDVPIIRLLYKVNWLERKQWATWIRNVTIENYFSTGLLTEQRGRKRGTRQATKRSPVEHGGSRRLRIE